VRSTGPIAAVLDQARADVAIRAGVEVALALAGGDRPVALDSGAHPDPHSVLGDRDELLLAGEVEAHRLAGDERQGGGDRLDLRIALRAVAAAERGNDDPDAGLRQPEDLRELRADDERDLGADPHRHPPVAHVGDAGVGLERDVLHRRAGEDVLEHFVGLREPLVGVALAQPVVVAHVRAALGVDDQVGKRLPDPRRPLVDERRALGQRVVEAEHRRQLVVLDIDQLDRLPSRVQVDGGDRGHRVADVADLVDGQDRLVAKHRAEPRLDVRPGGEIGTGQDGHHAGHGLRP
jgi:hypothetical protein